MHNPIGRRTFLRTASISLALPHLESMSRALASTPGTPPPRRLVAIGTPFGFDPTAFVPSSVGADYALTPHLEHLRAHRGDLTVITGTSHPHVGAAHQAEAVTLTGAPYPELSYNLQNTISVDQAFAEHQRGQTRFDSLVLSTGGHTAVPSISYTVGGVAIPPVTSPSEIFARLFLAGSARETAGELHRIREGRSMLDFLGEQTRGLSRRISVADRARVDEYYASVREVEKQLQYSLQWVQRPKPQPPQSPPKDITAPGLQQQKLQIMFDMIHLAFVTDSTRAISIRTFGDHHALTHHGQEAETVAALRAVEVELLQAFSTLLTKLGDSREGAGERLLDRTMVLLASNMRDGNSHRCHDVPIILAGGGFKHGRHLAFNRPWIENLARTAVITKPTMGVNQAPLCNLFVSLLQRAGIETDRFGSSTGPLAGLERV